MNVIAPHLLERVKRLQADSLRSSSYQEGYHKGKEAMTLAISLLEQVQHTLSGCEVKITISKVGE